MQNLLDVQSRWKRACLLTLLGLCAVAALPPIYLWPFAFVALSGLFLLLDRCETHKQAFLTGWFFGMGFFGGGLYWLTNAFLVHSDKHGWLVPIAVPALAAAMGLFIGATTFLSKMLWRNYRQDTQVWGRIVMFVAAWAVLEWARGWLFTGFPWNLMSTIWGFSDTMLQPTAYVGSYGYSTLTVLAATLPAAFFYLDKKKRPLAIVAGFALPALFWGVGTLRLQEAETTYHDGIVLRLVQPSIAQADKWDRTLKVQNFRDHLALSAAPGKDGRHPTHIIWPETAATYPLNREPSVRQAIADIVPPGGAVLTGTPRMTPRGQKPYQVWNSMVAVNERGDITATYDKAHLVPFGEYIPFRQFIPLPKLTAGMVDFSAGDGRKTIKLDNLPSFSPLICYEIIFPYEVIDPSNRPHWLLNLTNDGWYGNSPGPYQHLISAKMRSVEEGLPLVRAANTGVSVVTDAYGRVISHLRYAEHGFTDVGLPQRLNIPPWSARLGASFPLLLIGLFLLTGQRLLRHFQNSQ